MYIGERPVVIGIVRCRWVHWGAPWGRWVRSGLLGSLGYALEFVRSRWVNWGAPWGTLSSFGGR